MSANRQEIVAAFDARAASYGSAGWHRRAAERLVEVCGLTPGSRVLDAATGTGFAALAAARVLGGHGRVTGVDVSPGMLRQANSAVTQAGLTNVEFVEGDATHLPQYEPGSVDAITCASGLLYMTVDDALREWRRVLRPGGLVAFSSMCAGSPPGARIFRDCAAAFGVVLLDPCEELGSAAACARALDAAGFQVVRIVEEDIEFSAGDHARAWASNIGSPSHSAIRRLDGHQQRALEAAYLEAMARASSEDPGSLDRARILYAVGCRR